MSEHEWQPNEDEHTDFVINAEDSIDWQRQRQENPQYSAQDQLSVEWGSGEYIPMLATDADQYDGPYSADALFSAQSFATADKLMRENFSVRAINYTEAPNEYGTTVTIGG